MSRACWQSKRLHREDAEAEDVLSSLCSSISAQIIDLDGLVTEIDGDRVVTEWPEEGEILETETRRWTNQRFTTSSQAKWQPHDSCEGFNLQTINERFEAFVDGSEDRLEFEPFTKTRRKQVASLGNLYCVEARACGRAGQTFFRTPATRPLRPKGVAMAQKIIACSFNPPKPKKPKRKRDYSKPQSAPAVPVPDSNKGNQLLRGMGWQHGQGLGASSSGIVEPLIPERRPKNRGLGCD